MKRRIVALGTLILLGVALICGGCEKAVEERYVNDYGKEMGLKRINMTYNEIVNLFGEPEKIIEESKHDMYFMDLQYQDLIFYLSTEHLNDKENAQATYVEIVTDKYQFGEKKIKVGSTKGEVLDAYKEIGAVKECRAGEGYADGSTYVYFVYDENDMLKSIEIVPNGP